MTPQHDHQNDLTGRTIGRYRVMGLLGAGGMGRVYRAQDGALRRDVAIKVLNATPDGRSWRGHDPMAEARALSRLNHPRVATIYDLVSDSGHDFIVMELVPGRTLKEILDTGALPFADVLRLGQQLLLGLAAAHAVQLIHCDIKPSNLKVTPAGELKILDFGLARLMPSAGVLDLSEPTLAEFRGAGTVPYMSPEQFRGKAPDERSDIFSAGTVLYEMATGRAAFPERNVSELTYAILHEQPIPPSRVIAGVPTAFDVVVRKAMAKHPRDRYQWATDLSDALEQIEIAQSLRPSPPAQAEPHEIPAAACSHRGRAEADLATTRTAVAAFEQARPIAG
jgi:serine/threonine-protein kinase